MTLRNPHIFEKSKIEKIYMCQSSKTQTLQAEESQNAAPPKIQNCKIQILEFELVGTAE